MFANLFQEDSFMMKRAMPIFARLGKSRFTQTINNGLFFAMPMIFVAVVFQVVAMIFGYVVPENTALLGQLSVLQNLTFGLLGLFFTIGIAKTNAQLNKIVIDGPVTIAITLYFIFMKPTFADGLFNINVNYLGAQGLTLGLLSGFLAGEICGLFDRNGWTIKFKDMPAFMTAWFSNLIAGVLLITAAWALVYVANVDLMAWLAGVIAPVLVVSDTVWSMMLWGILGALSFSLGIHPAAVGGIFFPLFLTLAAENAALYADGLAPTAANGFHFATIGYVFALINIGGACATLGLNFLMLYSKNKAIKQLGQTAIIPSLLTVNEPLVFGLPIVFNPLLAFGALLVNGIINPILAYLFFVVGFIPAATNPALIIFLPSPVIALLNNMGFMGLLGSLVIIAVDVIAWAPFLRLHERQLALVEAAAK